MTFQRRHQRFMSAFGGAIFFLTRFDFLEIVIGNQESLRTIRNYLEDFRISDTRRMINLRVCKLFFWGGGHPLCHLSGPVYSIKLTFFFTFWFGLRRQCQVAWWPGLGPLKLTQLPPWFRPLRAGPGFRPFELEGRWCIGARVGSCTVILFRK